jgi:ribosomal protein L11 methyltransferase
VRWLTLRVRAPEPRAREEVITALIGLGASSVQEDGDDLLTYLPAGSDVAAVRDAIQRAGISAAPEYGTADDADWTATWKPTVGLHRVGGLTIAPPWLAEEAGDRALAVIIDPAMAFGTGEHPSTRGVLRLMQRTIRPGDMVADLGAGSAILSIAAAKLGAPRVAAIECDHAALGNAHENVERNGVAAQVTVLEGDAATLLPLVAPVDVVLANIVSDVLVRLSSPIHVALAPAGRAVLGGMSVTERDRMLGILHADAWRLVAEDEEGEWWCAAIVPR